MNRHRARGWALLSLLALAGLVTGGWFQSPPPSPSEVPPLTIRVSTHLVLVDVVVTDKQGKAVAGLRPEDFEVEENGKAQKISTFVPAGENLAAAPPLPPGIYSNRPQYRTPGGPVTVMLLDAVNTPFSDQGYARRQMLSFVQNQYQAGQRMAIFTLTGPLRVLQDFTSDPQILYAALQRYRPQAQEFALAGQPVTSAASGSPTSGSTVTTLDASTAPLTTASGNTLRATSSAQADSVQAALEAFAGAQSAYAEDQRAVLSLNALNSLARILGGLPGRKSIIWVTGNLPFSLVPENRTMTDAELEETLPSLNTRRVSEHASGTQAATFRQSHAGDIRELEARLASAQVAVYPIDARGLTMSTSIDSQETMLDIAHETGGRAYVNQNEIKFGVERAFLDSAASYTLGYYPENKKYDGKYRQIKVKVKRDGVDMQNRRGYFAVDPAQLKGYNSEREVASALSDAVPSTLIAFTARVLSSADNRAAKGKVGVDFLVDASTVSAEEAGNGKKLNVAFYAAVYSPAGKMVGNRSMKVDQAFDANTYLQILQHGLLLHMDLDPQPGDNQLRLGVQDNHTGLVGSLGVPMPQ
ncbi:MAG TPA: VWA domain-containing protein [Terriglobales bacterium]|nr:VWA domain-containing protein [Terriglobales bacterium]